MLNFAVQRLLGAWGHVRRGAAAPDGSRFLDQAAIDWFVELNRALQDRHDDASFRAALRANVQRLRDVARELRALARADGVEDPALEELLGPAPPTTTLLRGTWVDDATTAPAGAAA
jgi:hypothetical protein